MKQIVCELCEGTQFAKENGMFICQSCGMKYSVEEAKKLMVEVDGVTPPPATAAKSENSEELENLYQIARRAKDSDNSENAAKYYDMILVKDPNSWEANFYTVYFKAMCCKIGEIQASLGKVENCIEDTFKLIIAHVKDDQERTTAIKDVIERNNSIVTLMENAYERHYNGIAASIRSNYLMEYLSTTIAAATARTKPYICLYQMLADDEYVMLNYGHNALKKFIVDRENWDHTPKIKVVIAKYDNIKAEIQRKKAEEERLAQLERNKKYWEEHAEEKQALENEQAMLNERIAVLENEKDAIIQKNAPEIKRLNASLNVELPIEKAVKEQQSVIDGLIAQRNALGLFKGKEKKAITDRLDTEENPKLAALKKDAASAKKAHQEAINNQIRVLNDESKPLHDELKKAITRINEIERELTQNR